MGRNTSRGSVAGDKCSGRPPFDAAVLSELTITPEIMCYALVDETPNLRGLPGRGLTKASSNETINGTAVNQTLPPSVSTGSDATLLQPGLKQRQKKVQYISTQNNVNT